jgi:hypothetical protein
MAVYTFDYALDYDPPMPEVELTVSSLRGQRGVTLTALIDSGADASLIPVRYLQQIGAQPRDQKWLRGLTAGRLRVALYPVFVQIGPFQFYVSVVGDELYQEVIIGRDVLNQMIVTLNGLAQSVEISE